MDLTAVRCGRRVAVLAVLIGLVTAVGPAADAKSYSLPEADVAIRVNPDGSVDVTEQITFSFSGAFQGAYRDVTSRFGERVVPESVQVGEGNFRYERGGTTTLGAEGEPPNT